jgi:hypothetical protein
MDDPHNYVDDETARTISRNPDWLCSYCDALNSDDVHECYVCAASREDSEKNYFENRAEIEARRAERERIIAAASGEMNKSHRYQEDIYEDVAHTDNNTRSHDYKETTSAESSTNYNSSTTRDSGRNEAKHRTSTGHRMRSMPWGNIFKVGAGVLAAALIIACLFWIFTPKIQEVTIHDFSWERSINVEEYVTVKRDGWSLPADGRLLYSQQEIKTYEKVLDHYETKTRTYTEQVLDHYETYVSGYRDLGNGHFEEITSQRPVYRTETRTETYQEPVYRDEPVYATKYYYEIDVWQHAFYSKSSGNDKKPYWKEIELKELQREGGRSETYYIFVINKNGEEEKYAFDFDVWNSLEKGQEITIKTTIFGKAELVLDPQ